MKVKRQTFLFLKNFENNIEKARKYLNYNKIFITKYTDINGKQSLKIINDFVHPVSLSKILKLDNENKLKSENTNIFIKPSQLDINQKIIYLRNCIDHVDE